MTEQTERIHLTEELALKCMREAVDEYGSDYVYQSPDMACMYVYNGEASCLIGQVLVRAGVPVTAFGGGTINTCTIDRIVAYLPVTLSEHLVRALRDAQGAQDGGACWGEALEVLEAKLDRGYSA
jgi:hypothetical protein